MPAGRTAVEDIAYLCSGLIGRLRMARKCPSCESSTGTVVDRKYFHTLNACLNCHLLYRYPSETPAEMAGFYARAYKEPGLTTELPDAAALQRLLDTAFLGSSKDFTKNVAILRALTLRPGARVLEYGANWGYATWQFRRAGFNVSAFEIAPSRAQFGARLGVEIQTCLDHVGTEFDAVYSSHVLEHVPNPAAVLREQLALVKKGGVVICHTPNGSRSYRDRSKTAFHHLWGQVHPVLLTDAFVVSLARLRPFLVTSDDEPAEVGKWNPTSQELRDTSGPGLFFVIRQSE